jgi:hypothetical protein
LRQNKAKAECRSLAQFSGSFSFSKSELVKFLSL